MKALLLKDFYMALKYCRSYLFIIVAFLAMAFLEDEYTPVFLLYPCMLSVLLPVTLLSYDEQSKWNVYCGTLPYTKTQIVSAKYLIGTFTQLIMLVLTAVTMALKMSITGNFDTPFNLEVIVMLMVLSCIPSSFILPFMFKFGVTRGRFAYFVMICLFSAGAGFMNGLRLEIIFNIPLLPIFIAAVGIYALSWRLSVLFYKKREIT